MNTQPGQDLNSSGRQCLYFGMAPVTTPNIRDMYRTPVLGGEPEFITKDVNSGPTFSPDGRDIAFARRNNPELSKG
ncbi:MAG: hypothetical protein WAK20_05025, partial [Candidatus Acidiferrum sp.]